jgi:hypothetical protein
MFIEVTFEQAEQFRAAGVKVYYGIKPQDVSVSPQVEAPAVDKPRRAVTRGWQQKWGKFTTVRLAPNYAKLAARTTGKLQRELYAAISMVVTDAGGTINRSELRNKVSALVGRTGDGKDGVSTLITAMLRKKMLLEVTG